MKLRDAVQVEGRKNSMSGVMRKGLWLAVAVLAQFVRREYPPHWTVALRRRGSEWRVRDITVPAAFARQLADLPDPSAAAPSEEARAWWIIARALDLACDGAGAWMERSRDRDRLFLGLVVGYVRFSVQDDYVRSIPHHESARARAQRTGDRVIEAAALANIGVVYDRMANDVVAVPYMLRAVELVGHRQLDALIAASPERADRGAHRAHARGSTTRECRSASISTATTTCWRWPTSS